MDLMFATNLVQFFIYILIVFVAFRLKVIPSWITLYLSILGSSPFWFNGVLFSPEYMPDQFKYLKVVLDTRNFEIYSAADIKTVYISGLMLSIMPVPFVFNVIGVAFINKFIFLMLFIWFYYKKYLRGIALYFTLLYPDLILYTSLALRDTIILSFMLLGAIALIHKKYFLFFMIISPLLFIKFQNFFLMLILLTIMLFLHTDKNSKQVNKLKYFSIFITFFIIFYFVAQYFIELLNFYRQALFIEDGGDMRDYISITNMNDFIFLAILGPISFLLKPFLFEASNTLQIIQSFENIMVFLFLCWFTVKSYKINKNKTLLWLTFLIVSLMVYGLIVFNSGTAVRYKFPFIVLFVVALQYDLRNTNKIRIRGNNEKS